MLFGGNILLLGFLHRFSQWVFLSPVLPDISVKPSSSSHSESCMSPCTRRFKCFVLNTLCSKTKHLRSLVPDFEWLEELGDFRLKMKTKLRNPFLNVIYYPCQNMLLKCEGRAIYQPFWFCPKQFPLRLSIALKGALIFKLQANIFWQYSDSPYILLF